MAASPAFPRVPLLLLLMMSYLRTALAQNPDCSANRNNQIYENNRPGISVTPIFADTGVTVTINQDQGSEFFEIINNELILKTSLDYETTQAIVLRLSCERNGVPVQTLTVIVEVLGVNDETPVFNLDFVAWDLPEDAKVGTSLAALTATDLDYDLIYYDLGFSSQNVSSHFTLTGSNSPVIQVSKALDYDSFTHVQLTLYARDTSDPNANISHTASATINVTILDVDNKNPWFKPCRFIDSSKKICHSDGYKVNVTRSVQATGALALDPGPLYAVDGDQGINEAVTYHIISGNDQDIFDLNSMTGNITMKKAADVLGTTVLEVMASQANNTLRYAITTVRIQVVEKNNHAPTFPSTNYQGTVPAFSLPGSLVMEYLSPSRPLKIFAADADFPGGRNPDVTYSLQNSSDFSVTQDGFIQSAAQLNHSITIVVSAAAIDRTSGEEATTLVLVEVTPAAGIETTTAAATTVIGTTAGLTSSARPPGTATGHTVNPPKTTTSASSPGSSISGITNKPTAIITGLPPQTMTVTTIPGTPGKPATGNPSITVSRVTPPVPSSGPTRPTAPPLPPGFTTTKPPNAGTGSTVGGTTRPTSPPSVGPPDSRTTNVPKPGTGTTARPTPPPSAAPPNTRTTSTPQPGTGITTRRSTTITVPISVTPPGSGTTTPSTARTGPTTSSQTKTATTPATPAKVSPGDRTTTPTATGTSPSSGIPVVGSQLGYSAADMAAVGATLGVVLLICLAFLGFLIHKQYGHKFKRNSETDGTFSSEGSGDTNDSNNRLIDNEEVEPTISGSTAVENEDGVLNLNFNVSETTTDSSVGRGAAVRLTAEPNLGAAIPAAFIAAEQLQEDLDNDKEVKSILTKERRVNDESYKAVWFKGDIEPDEVVMINEHEQAGEGQEDDSEEEDEDDDEGEDGEENQGSDYIQTPTVAFSTLNEPGDTTESTNTML
ncbi:cadherin-related family member 5 isoform X2 [Ambystoma mexicanum]|uniref:cadherin-related family member 5 isoform X2 n=1 Tax=Ambystoma mexicanum TaxID=8296 RepID=UPI0037E9A003